MVKLELNGTKRYLNILMFQIVSDRGQYCHLICLVYKTSVLNSMRVLNVPLLCNPSRHFVVNSLNRLPVLSIWVTY